MGEEHSSGESVAGDTRDTAVPGPGNAERLAQSSDVGPRLAPSRRWLVGLTVAAVLTRLLWNLWVHPPTDYVYSDMARYVERATALAQTGFRPGVRTLAWQTFGTHYLLAVPIWMVGTSALWVASVVWALMGAAAIPLGYLLACRTCRHAVVPPVVGVVLVLWVPNLTNSGYFLSEAPFVCFQLWATYWLVVTMQQGRRALGAGLVGAIAFAVRPQSALFFLLALLTWWLNRRRLTAVRVRHLLLVAAPLLLMLVFSLWRFNQHTGYWGIAENANMNLTAGRCHNIVTQAFRSERLKRRSERNDNTRDGRRVSLPGFRILQRRVPDDHPLGLRPALESETIRFVGYIGDADVHRRLRQTCYEATGLWGQIRYSMVNISLLWFVGHQWPEMERGRRPFFVYSEIFKHVYQVGVWLPSLFGVGWALRRICSRPALSLVAWQLVTSMTVAAIFFGTIRLRSPYDPYAIIVAVEMIALGILRFRRRR